MRQEYEIEIQEVLSRIQKVKADSLGEAIDKAMEMYEKEQIVLDSTDFKEVDFSLYELNKEKEKGR